MPAFDLPRLADGLAPDVAGPIDGLAPDVAGPNVVGVGVDLVDTERFARVIARTPGLVGRVFTEAEVELSGGERLRPASLAARWAAKEAVAKVLVNTSGLHWHDCQVLAGDRGEPLLRIHGTVAAAARDRGIGSWLMSLSHDGHMAIAFVVALRSGDPT